MKKLYLILLFAFCFLLFAARDAKAQTCTTTPPTNTGRVEHILTDSNTTAGTYRVWARMKAADTTNNSFYLKIDNGCVILVGDNSGISSTDWNWVNYKEGNTTNYINVNLAAGVNDITIIGNEPGVGVDKLLMTKNLTCIPTGISGDNCPAEIPATPTSSPVDTTPPVISNPRATEVTGSSVNIRWELDEFASGQVEYRLTSSQTWQATGLQTCCQYNYHIQAISGLTNGVTYVYRIKSTDASGNEQVSTNCTFTTGGASSQACSINDPSTSPTLTPTKTPTPTLTPTLTPTKTPTPTITPTPAPNATILKFNSIKLHGIGNGGDNTNPNLAGNLSPITTTRTLTVELINNGGTQPATSGNIIFKPNSGDFAGEVIASSNIPSGAYLVKVKSPKYLKRQLVGIITITTGTTNIMPAVTLVTGDINNDNALTISDYNILIDCYSDLLPAKNCSDTNKKASADISDDGNVNASDYNLFLRELSVVSGE